MIKNGDIFVSQDNNSSWKEGAERHFRIVSKLEAIRENRAHDDTGMGVPLLEAKETHEKIINKLESLRDGITPPSFPQSAAFPQPAQDVTAPAQSNKKPASRTPSARSRGKAAAAANHAGISRLSKSQMALIMSPIKFIHSILFKLITIVAILLLVSLGTMTTLVSILVSSDVKLTAEMNNLSVNRRNAAAVNNELKNIRSSALSFINDVLLLEKKSAGSGNALSSVFFTHNPDVFAIVLVPQDGAMRFLMPADEAQAKLPLERASDWLTSEDQSLQSVREGEMMMRNVSPFADTPGLVMLLPVTMMTNEEEQTIAAAVFFSPEKFDAMLSAETNISFLINEEADVLAHPDSALVMGAVNLSKIPFIESAISSAAHGTQTIYTDENNVKYFGVFQRLAVGNSILVTIVKEADVLRGPQLTTNRNIVLSGIVLLLSLLAITVFGRWLSRPLRSLTVAARKIEQGEYELELSHKSNDEIGALTQSFTGMGYGLQNFERFTNKAVVAMARRGKLSRGGVNKQITVSFIFIRDFGELARDMSAAQIVGFINEYLGLMVPCVTATGGIVDKFLTQDGVIIMAVWGSIDSAGSPALDAYNCLRSMLMIRMLLVNYNRELSKRFWGYAPLIKIGCGINSGEVVTGQMGSEQRMEYTVIGDAVNLAARLEGANDAFDTDILISEQTCELVKDKIAVSAMPHLDVKGKAKPLQVFAAINARTEEDMARIFDDLQNISRTINIKTESSFYWTETLDDVRKLWSGKNLSEESKLADADSI